MECVEQSIMTATVDVKGYLAVLWWEYYSLQGRNMGYDDAAHPKYTSVLIQPVIRSPRMNKMTSDHS
jgi:hypothetical protein